MDSTYQVGERHLFIAGTGRAGTSFLVRYLSELGLDTHLDHHGDGASWDEEANAGLEDTPFQSSGGDLPYVMKSPWLYAYIDELVARGNLRPDAVIIPVRDLAEATISRSVVERRAIHQEAAWMSEQNPSWEHWAHVPGGMIYSLNPIDQGRLLAVGFHHLVQRLVAADIPIVFLAFPRFVEDAEYLFDKLRSLLPVGADSVAARAAHQRVADLSKVRVGTEIEPTKPRSNGSVSTTVNYPSHAQLDAIAMKRELRRLRRQLSMLEGSRSWRLTRSLRVIETLARRWRDNGWKIRTLRHS